MKAYSKDIFRSIWRTKKRFFSLLIIVMLGIAVLTGIFATCQNMYYSADKFYDEQRLYDIRVLSTLGLTDEDIAALENVTGVSGVDGGYSEDVKVLIDGTEYSSAMTVLSDNGLNQPYVFDGKLPESGDEIAVTQKYLDYSGKGLGDMLEIEEGLGEEEAPAFPESEYKITALVLDPQDINSSEAGFRSSNATDFVFFVAQSAASHDIYTSIYLTLSGAAELDCYSDEYSAHVNAAIDKIESEIMRQREEARYNAVIGEALEKVTDAENEMDEEFAEADTELADAWDEIEKAKQELLDGEAELTEEEKTALQKLSDAAALLENGKAELLSSEAELKKAEAELQAGEAELLAGEAKLRENKEKLAAEKAAAMAELAAAEAQLNAKQSELYAQIDAANSNMLMLKTAFGDSWPEAEWGNLAASAASVTAGMLAENPTSAPDISAVASATVAEQNALAAAIIGLPNPELQAMTENCISAAIGMGIVNGSRQVLSAQISALEEQKAAATEAFAKAEIEIAQAEAQLNASRITISAGKTELEAGRREIAAGRARIANSEAELQREKTSALEKLARAWADLAAGKEKLADGEAEFIKNEREYADKKAEAEEEIAEAYAEIEDIDMAQWYVQDRSAISSFSSMKDDVSSIEAVGNIFPVIFLIVAVLISLTTMTRMVEEDRGLIGTYMALGFGGRTIYRKYWIYALLACVIGGLLGSLVGFVFMPEFLYTILGNLYTIPVFYLRYEFIYGIGGIVFFAACIVTATLLTCRGELKHMPAILMRPKAPGEGSRVLLEKAPIIWNRLKFLNKVTVRNLFRYKKRLFMTIIGIMGCTGLVLTGFAIKDTVTDLMPKQYDIINHYDLLAVTNDDDNAELVDIIAGEAMEEYINLRIDNIKMLNKRGAGENVQLIVVPENAELGGYINLMSLYHRKLELTDEGVYLTRNAAELLGINAGDRAVLQQMTLDRYNVQICEIVKNYLGNYVYITQALYEELIGEYKPNAVLGNLSASVSDQGRYAEDLLSHDIVLTSVSTTALKADFSENFTLMNSVVYVFIFFAAGLAFVVLFTLANTNISERERELATIKVLGFFDREVHSYVNKETLLLTVIGVLAGLPFGYLLSVLLTNALKMPSIYFAVAIYPLSFVLASVISFCFAIVVNLMTNRTLDKVDMVEALKSVE